MSIVAIGFPLSLQKYSVMELYFFAVFDRAFVGQVYIAVADWSESLADSLAHRNNLIRLIDIVFGQFEDFLCEVRLAAVLFDKFAH